MSFIYPLASSSSGNCIYVGDQKQGILIDAGIGIRSFAAHMALIGIHSKAIQGIFVTHEHSDHIKGLARIQQALKVPVYASRGTLKRLLEKQVLSVQAPTQLATGEGVRAGSFQITAFPTPHDCEESQCYRIGLPDGKQVSVCTDLGHMTEEIHSHLVQSDLVMLESNYEESLLAVGKYPFFLKRRISGAHGHLSNEDCGKEIKRLYEAGVKRFVLGHLSEENNRPELAYANIVHILGECGAVAAKDFELMVAPKANQGKWMEIK